MSPPLWKSDTFSQKKRSHRYETLTFEKATAVTVAVAVDHSDGCDSGCVACGGTCGLWLCLWPCLWPWHLLS